MSEPYADYGYPNSGPTYVSSYLWDATKALLTQYSAAGASVLEAGCGNGSFARALSAQGYRVAAFDLSPSGIDMATTDEADVVFRRASVYDDLRSVFEGAVFDVVVSLEVIEHLYDPRLFLSRIREVLRPGGYIVLSTPYHGYLKNLVLALSGRMDDHFSALWQGGHIKFWSRRTLGSLLGEMGFDVVDFRGVGRSPYLWKSMIFVARKK